MLKCGTNWQPNVIERFIEAIPTSTGVMKVKTDAGIGYIKVLGKPGNNQYLASELVGSELAHWIGLQTLDFAVISVSADQIDLPFPGHQGYAASGPAFITKEKEISVWDGHASSLRQLSNPNDISVLIIFDTWVRNTDRFCLELSNYDNFMLLREKRKKFLLLSADHTHCFVEYDIEDLQNNNYVDDETIYGYHPVFVDFIDEDAIINISKKLSTIDKNLIKAIVHAIPSEWGISSLIRDRWVDLIYERALFVAENAPNKILKQLRLGI